MYMKDVIPIRYEGEPNIFTLSEPEVLLDKEFICRVIALLSAASHLIGITSQKFFRFIIKNIFD